MSLWKRVFGSPATSSTATDGETRHREGEALYRQAVGLFGQNKFSDAVRLLEQAAIKLPNSPAVFFTLGTTYMRAAPDGDERAMIPWAQRSVSAFQKAVALHKQFGGLNDKQLATATEMSQVDIERLKKNANR